MNKKLRSLFFILSCLLIVGCSRKAETLTITVVNPYMKYVETSETNGIISSYKDEATRSKATNVVTFSISNPTDKKYLLVINTDSPEPVYSNDFNHIRPSIAYRILNNKNEMKRYIPGIADNFSTDSCLDCSLDFLTGQMEEYKKLGITKSYSPEVYDYLHNAVTIYPGEKRTFKSIVKLPIVLEPTKMGGGIIRYKNLENTDTFELVYGCKSAHLKAKLPKYILDELEYNKIEIFDGEILSNKVKLRKVE
ncbi:MAG: hypothetical protein ACLGH8_04785 [Bacteroidia bacterium]